MFNEINLKSKTLEKEINPLERKRTGSYYTDNKLTDILVEDLMKNVHKRIEDITFLEPCIGTGNFVFSYLNYIYRHYSLDKRLIKRIIKNIYVADINEMVLQFYRDNLKRLVKNIWNVEILDSDLNIIDTGLIVNVKDKSLQYLNIHDIFQNVQFDIIMTNPPYKNLKAEMKHYDNEFDYNNDKILYQKINNTVKEKFKYCNDGILNLYKIFVEEILTNYSSQNSFISLLIPNTILTDKSCEKLRNLILKDYTIVAIRNIKENNDFIDAKQSMCNLLLKKDTLDYYNIKMYDDIKQSPKSIIRNIDIEYSELGNPIINATNKEWNIIRKLRKDFPTIKELDFIKNLRGEFDLTLYKKYITEDSSNYPLIRGRHLQPYKIENYEEYCDNEFITVTKKLPYIRKDRIACQQVSNLNKKERIFFSYIPKNYILGNTCNFLSVDNNEYGIDLYNLLGILNSKMINWYFKLFSSNNHIANYEIDSFPIVIESKDELLKLSNSVKIMISDNNFSIEKTSEINMIVNELYKIQ